MVSNTWETNHIQSTYIPRGYQKSRKKGGNTNLEFCFSLTLLVPPVDFPQIRVKAQPRMISVKLGIIFGTDHQDREPQRLSNPVEGSRMVSTSITRSHPVFRCSGCPRERDPLLRARSLLKAYRP
jgi:hypothetical protein